jgi:eukaryotic-like serine/threonine-protein kinase
MKVQMKEEELLFEKFNILECLKKDDNSSVYIATSIQTKKKVILKILNTTNLADDSILERFKREAKVLVNIDHPNVIKVLDFGTYNNFFFISFEYFESVNLRSIIRENKLTKDEKKKLVIQLFTGLEFAHKNQIIHRDIKPENILISKNLELKIGDFGLALSLNDSFVTSQFHIVGTPTYMSPEQIRGDKLTSKSDLFSASLVTYEIYTGINPFLGKDVNDTLNKIISWDEDKLINLSSIESLPAEIHDLIIGLLHNDPDQRIEDASKVLEILLNKPDGKNRRIRRKKKYIKELWILSTILFIILLMLLIKQYYYSPILKPIAHPGNDTLKQNKISEQIKQEIKNNDANVKKDELKPETTISTGDVSKETSVNQEKMLQMPFIKKTGSLFIECFPWAYIYIDSLKTDITPLKNNLILNEGEHLIQLMHPNYPTYARKVMISGNGNISLKVNLDTLFAYLDCKVNPWCEIYVDGKLKGQTPLQSPIKILPGEHHILLKNSEFEPVEYNIKSGQGQTYTIRYNFKKNN